MDIWDTVRTERLATADLLESLTEEQWAAQSLCGEWSVKNVAVHLAPTLGNGMREFAGALARARGNVHRASETIVAKHSTLPPDEVVAAIRDGAGSRFAAPTLGPESQLAEVMVHRLDMAVPLGLTVQGPTEAWGPVLDFLVGSKARRGFVQRGLPQATYAATDLEWLHGTGPMVSGPAAALALTISGREALLDELAGPGREELAAWVRA